MKTFVLVDSENTPLKNADFARDENVELRIFIGRTQTKFPRELVLAVHELGPRASYVAMDGSGKNALDFHLAYYLGRLAAQHPDARFVVVSKDTGFDPLIAHMVSQGVGARRVPDGSLLAPAGAKAPRETGARADLVEKRLRASPKNRPARLKTLHGTIQGLFGKDAALSEDDLRGIVATLQTRGVLTVQDTKIVYTLPG